MTFVNSYRDATRAASYAKLEYPGTYYLAYRDLPQIVLDHVGIGTAMDVGCGTGRSTRFLKALGFDTVGVDIAEDMILEARETDPEGTYHLVADGDLGQFEDDTYDLVLSVFTFDNMPTMERMAQLSEAMGRVLKPSGRIVNLTSAPELYGRDWASFTTSVFPENTCPKSGDTVRVIVTDMDDQRPVEDVFWTVEDYDEVFRRAGLEVVTTYKPLAKEEEPYEWVSETEVAPWMIYVLRRCAR